jgi:zinc protease
MKISNPQHSLPCADDISRILLPNGITILVRTNFNSPSVVIGGYLPCGSLFDPEEKLGLADFTASSLLRGGEKRDFQKIFDDLESTGANLSFSAGGHSTGFTGRCLSEDLPLLLDILGDALRRPVFPGEQVERLRAQLLTGLAIRAQDTSEMASITFDQIVFEGHPYAHPEDGWPETIKAISREDLHEFHRIHYGPKGLVLAIVGAIQPKDIVLQVEKVMGDWINPDQPGSPDLPELKQLKKTITRKVKIPNKSQADLVIGSSGPRRKGPEFMPASLGNSILGQFGMGGRIGEIVREKSGLAYFAASSLSTGLGPGAWDVSAGVNPANVKKVCNLISREITRFVEKGVTTEELADNQSSFIGRLPLSLESNAGVVNALLNIERFDLGVDYYRCYPDLVRAVTLDEVAEVARKYLHPDKLAIAIAGS